jgi:hypothetical protein
MSETVSVIRAMSQFTNGSRSLFRTAPPAAPKFTRISCASRSFGRPFVLDLAGRTQRKIPPREPVDQM